MPRNLTKEILMTKKDGTVFVDTGLSMHESQEVYEQLLQKCKEFANLIYLQKDLQRDL